MILALGRCDTDEPFPSGDAKLGPDSAVTALLMAFNPATADGVDATYELRLDDQVFRARVADARVDFARGTAQDPGETTTPGRWRRCCGTA